MMGTLWFWLWRLVVTVVLVAIAIIHRRGWQHLQKKPSTSPPAFVNPTSKVAFIAFQAGLFLLFLVTVSPLAQLPTQFFSARVAQHLLLIAWIPALLWAGNPLPTLYEGLPPDIQVKLSGHQITPMWQARLRQMTAPAPTWLSFICCYWLWYDPTLHQLTVDYPGIRLLEVTMLLSVALLHWWHITASTPHEHQLPLIGRVVYTFTAIMPIKSVGLILLFGESPAYTYPSTFQFSGLVINDFSLGSMLIWVLGGTVYSTTAVILMRRWLTPEDEKPVLPAAMWDTEEAMLAPGIKK